VLGFGNKKKKSVKLDGYDIPSFPSTVLDILGKLRNPEVPVNEIAQALEVDPGLHVRVLKTVNSVSFGLSHKVSNIRHAVNLLGRGRVESLVLSVAVKEGITRNHQAAWLNMNDFWATASRRAAIARGLSSLLHPNIQSDVFTIGLLQDMAVPIFASTEGDRYRNIYESWLKNDDSSLTEHELKHLSTDHAKLGSRMAEHWGFPKSLIAAIEGHHNSGGDVSLSVKIAALIKGTPEADDSQVLVDRIDQLFGSDTGITVEVIDEIFQESLELTAALN